MPSDLVIRFRNEGQTLEIPAVLIAKSAEAKTLAAEAARGTRAKAGVIELFLAGDRDYFVAVNEAHVSFVAALERRIGRNVLVVFPERSPVRRRLVSMWTVPPAPLSVSNPIDLTLGREGAEPLWLLPNGRFSSTNVATEGVDEKALVAAARWITSRRTTTFERLFAPSAFRPDEPVRTERLTAEQAVGLLTQVKEALAFAAVNGSIATADENRATQVRSACATVLSHILGTVNRDPTFRSAADEAAQLTFSLISAEQGQAAKPMLRGHVIQLLQMRAPALSEADAAQVRTLVRSLVRERPPYESLVGPWRFAMCSASEFHDGECDILVGTYRFTEVPTPADAPKPPGYGGYRVFQAPFKNPSGEPIFIFARSALPFNENFEMGQAYFIGMLINRHAQLGSYDMRASTANVKQVGYKLMMNSQCAGLTTRFAISRLFPDADIYSSWDSTYFRNPSGNKVVASEGVDCFVALLNGMAAKESHLQITQRTKKVEWYHPQSRVAGFVQFIGPAHPLVVARYNDVNQDGKADYYDGFMDFLLYQISEDVYASITPRDPAVRASQISGEAATGLGWAAGSMNRVTQYSDIWSNLPGEAEGLYVYQSGGFFSHKEVPNDVPVGDSQDDLALLPVVCRYSKSDSLAGLSCEVMFHSYLSHAAKELKRLLVAAEAMNRAFDLGYLPKEGLMAKAIGRRGALLLTMAGLLEYPADQNAIDGLWSMALKQLHLPDISRSVVRGCMTEADHDASNYYGSMRGLKQLVGTGESENSGDLGRADPAAFERLRDPDPTIGRARPLMV